jgi:hypothetical protein
MYRRNETMKNNNFAKVPGLVLIMLLLLAVSVAPVMAADATCGSNDGTAAGAEVTVELSGMDKTVLIEKALQNDEVKTMQGQLKERGFSEKGTKASSVSVSLKDGSVVEVRVAVFQYLSPDGKEQDLNYIENTKTGETLVVLSTGADCLTCLVRLVSSGSLCLGACVSAGVFTGGVVCIGCLGLLGAWTACPCYHCACDSLGQACDLAAACSW